jgi:hypothetical protein
MSEPSETRAAFTFAKAMAKSASPPTIALSPGPEDDLVAPVEDLTAPRRRSFIIPVIVFGFTALLTAVGIYRLPGPQIQTEVSNLAQPAPNEDRPSVPRSPVDGPLPKQAAKSVNPFKSYALDVAELYLFIANFSKSTMQSDKNESSQKK